MTQTPKMGENRTGTGFAPERSARMEEAPRELREAPRRTVLAACHTVASWKPGAGEIQRGTGRPAYNLAELLSEAIAMRDEAQILSRPEGPSRSLNASSTRR